MHHTPASSPIDIHGPKPPDQRFRSTLVMRIAVALLAVFSCAFAVPRRAAAQCTSLNPPCMNQRPHPEIVPASGSYNTASVAFTVTWTDDKTNFSNQSVKLNGVDVTSMFTNAGASWSATLTLAPGDNTIVAHTCDWDGACGDNTAVITYRPLPASQPYEAAAVWLRNPGETVRPVSPADAVAGYSTPAYVSRDEARSVSLLYTGTQAQARAGVSMDVRNTSQNAPSRYSILVQDSVTGQTVAAERFFTSRSGGNILGAAWFATGVPTGVRTYNVVVRSYWDLSRGAPRDTMIEAPAVRVHLPIINEASSPYGAGWIIAGLQRVYPQANGDVAITNGDGSIEVFTSLGGGMFKAPDGDWSRLTFTASGNVSYTRYYPDGGQVMFGATGRALYLYDRFGNHTDFAYDGSGRVTTITDPAGKVTTLAYFLPTDGVHADKLQSITDPPGRHTYFAYWYGSNNLSQITEADGGPPLTFGYDGPMHRLLTRTSTGGAVTSFAYDSAGLLAADTLPAVGVEGGGVQRPVVRILSPEARSLGGSSGSPAAAVTSGATEYTDARGSVTKVTYDRWGQTAYVEAPYDTTVIFRNPQGQPVRVVAPTGAVTTYAWSGPDLLHVHETFPGMAHTAAFDRHHDYWPDTLNYHTVTQAVDAGAVVYNRYGSHGELLRSWAGTDSTHATVYGYDAADRYRLTSVTDPLGHQTTNTYEAAGAGSTYQNLSSSVAPHPDGGVVSYNYTYDSFGRPSVLQSPDGYQRFTYDGLNRDTLTVDEMNDTTRFAFPSDTVSTVRDATGKVYTFNTNQLGWTKSEVHPNGATRTYGYDVGGNLVRATDRRATSVTMTYDGGGRLATRTADGVTMNFGYGTAKNPWVSAVSSATTDTVWYDALGRVGAELSVFAGQSFSRTSIYDKAGPRTELSYTGGSGDASWIYDNSMLLTRVTTGGAYAATILGYNSDGLPNTISIPMSSTSTLTQTITYTGTHMPATASWNVSAVNGAFGHSFKWTGTSRMMRRSDIFDQVTRRNFTYDYAGRLTGKTDLTSAGDTLVCTNPSQPSTCQNQPNFQTDSTVAYSYDRVGNRTDSGASLIASTNRYQSFGGFTLVYDAEGNLTSKTKTGYSQTYTWNALGQLSSVTTNGVTVNYTYDGFGRRVKRDQGGTVNYYVYDEDDLLLELNASGAVIREYSYYPGTDQPHSLQVWSGSTSTKYYYVMEYPGNVTGLVNTANQVVNQYHYTPWGVAETNTSETVSQPLRFMARELDSTTGLYYVRARWYDPTLGRFNSEDPIGLDGGINQYAYVENGPTNGRDPAGLDPDDDCVKMMTKLGSSLQYAQAACKSGFGLPSITATVPWPFTTPRDVGSTFPLSPRGGFPNGFILTFLPPKPQANNCADVVTSEEIALANRADAQSRVTGTEEAYMANTLGIQRGTQLPPAGPMVSVQAVVPPFLAYKFRDRIAPRPLRTFGYDEWIHNHPSGGGISVGDSLFANIYGMRVVSGSARTGVYGSINPGGRRHTCKL